MYTYQVTIACDNPNCGWQLDGDTCRTVRDAKATAEAAARKLGWGQIKNKWFCKICRQFLKKKPPCSPT